MRQRAAALLERDAAVAALLGALALAIYLVSAIGSRTEYDYFGRLAHAFTRGEYWIDDAPRHLDELVRGVGGHSYNVVPPLVPLLLVPLVPFGPPRTIQTFGSTVIGALAIVPLYLALRALGAPRGVAVWSALLSSFGTTLWVSAVDGRSWFAADAAGVLFGALALLLAAAGRSPALLGAALGLAALARPPIVLAAPALLLLARSRRGDRPFLQDALLLLAGLAPFGLVEAGYNLLRWGTPLEVGYALQAASLPGASRGLVSLSYLPRHLYVVFFEGPAFVDNDPFFLRAHANGMSMFIATPAYLWLARAGELWRSSRDLRLLAAASALVLLPNLFWVSAGYDQYGYRRSMDAQPFLIAILALVATGGAARPGVPSVLFRAAAIASIVITLYFLVQLRVHGFAR